jgi:hypothetical protein
MKQVISSLEKDFLASNLRSQLNIIQALLNSLEENNDSDRGYTVESLRRTSRLMRDLRFFLDN